MNDSIEIELDTLKITGDATTLWSELAKASLEFVAVPKTATGQIGKDRKFKYADFVTLMRCVRPALSSHGIAVLQPLHYREENAITTTILAGHGATIQSSFAFPADSNPQEFGRHHTYYRRYQLQAMLGLGGDDDADNLPDVNTERPEGAPQFTEQKSEPKNEVPKEVSADKKSAPAKAASKEPSASPKESTKPSTGSAASQPQASVPLASAGPVVEDLKTINKRLQDGMDELKWDMAKLKEFYAEHVDADGKPFEKASNLTIEQKTALLDKLVSVAGITPF